MHLAGVCQFCRCPGDSCKDSSGDRCGWVDSTRTCCTAGVCLRRLHTAATAPASAAPLSQPAPAKSFQPKPVRPRRSYTAAAAWARFLTK